MCESLALIHSFEPSHLSTAQRPASNDNQNIKTNEKQTLNDKFKRTQWQKYEIFCVSQESSRWTACSSESALNWESFSLPLSFIHSAVVSSQPFRCVSISICIQHGDMITFSSSQNFSSFFVHIIPCMFVLNICRRLVVSSFKCYKVFQILLAHWIYKEASFFKQKKSEHVLRMEPVTGTWLREKKMKRRKSLAWKCQEKLNWHFAKHWQEQQLKKTTWLQKIVFRQNLHRILRKYDSKFSLEKSLCELVSKVLFS